MVGDLLSNFVSAVAQILDVLLRLYFWVLLIASLLSFVNPDPRNPIVRFLYSVTEPVLFQVRRRFPFVVAGSFDFSPLLVMLGILFLQTFVVRSLFDLASRLSGMPSLPSLNVEG